MMIFRQTQLLDLQQEPPLAYCDQCESEQYKGDTLYAWEGIKICGECVEEKFDCMTTKEKADLLGAECVEVGGEG